MFFFNKKLRFRQSAKDQIYVCIEVLQYENMPEYIILFCIFNALCFKI